MTEFDRPVHQSSDSGQSASRMPLAKGKLSWRSMRRVKQGMRLVLALATFTLLFYWLCGVGRVNIHHPFDYTGDAVEKLAYQVQDYLHNDFDTRMRAPFELATPENGRYVYNALFQSDSNLIWIAKLIGGGKPVKSLNLAYLFTFLLVFISGYWVCGRLGLSDPFRFCAASLFALMPYHFQRGEDHLLESTYYFVPFMVLLMLEVWSARPIACKWVEDRWKFTWRDRRMWYAFFLLAFLTSFNPYHQFFFACLVASAAPFAAVYRRNWRILIVGLALAGFACSVLVMRHTLTHFVSSPDLALGVTGQGITGYGQAELYPLKLAQLLLPVGEHRWGVLASIRDMYNVANPLNNENSTTTLGLVGSIGFLSCVVLALMPNRGAMLNQVARMGLITLIAILFGVMGGFSSLISTISNVVLGPYSMLTQARSWNRIAIFIGFFAYFTAFWLVQKSTAAVASRTSGGHAKSIVGWSICAAVFAFALWDQVPYKIDQQDDGHYVSDVQFFGGLESTLPKGAKIFQLPFVAHHWSAYVLPGVYYTQQLRPYVTSQTLSYTYGGDRGSLQSEWYYAATALPPVQAATYLCSYGFAGVLLQRNMVVDPSILEGGWSVALKASPQFSKDGDYSFFDIRSFCASHNVRQIDVQALKARLMAQLKSGKHFIPGGAFDHRIGNVELAPDGNIVITSPENEAGWLAFGPAEPLKRGKYRATFEFTNLRNSGDHTLDIDINVHGYATPIVLNRLSFVPQSSDGVISKSIAFTVSDPSYSSFDYRVRKDAGMSVDFRGVQVERLRSGSAASH